MNSKRKSLIMCLMASVLPFNCLAQTSESNTNEQAMLNLTLPEAIRIALEENPTIKVADKEIQLKELSDKEAWQNLLPSVDATLGLQNNIKVAEMKTSMGTFKMGMDGTVTASGGITIALPVFAPAVYKNMKLTKEDILLAQEKAHASRLDLINQVKKAYYAALLSQDSYEVMQRSYNVAKENYDVVSQKYEVGRVSEYDKISAEVQMRSMNSNVVSAQTGVTLSKLQLKVLMGVTSDIDINIADSLRSYEQQIVLPSEYGYDEVENNTNLKQLDHSMNMLTLSQDLLRTSFMPTVSASLTGQYQSMSNNNWNFFNYSYSPSITFALSINVPIFHMTNWTKIKSNKLQISQLSDTRDNTKRQLNMAAQSYRQNMIATVAKIESNRQAVTQADKAVSISSKRYDVGRGTILEVNQSETALTQAELTYNQSIYDYLTNKADLEYTLGRE